MQPYLDRHFGNPSSIHGPGRRARAGPRRGARDGARASWAPSRARSSSPPAGPRPTTWPSRAWPGPPAAEGRPRGDHQRRAPGGAARVRQSSSGFGFEVTYLPVDRHGRVDPADVADGHPAPHDAGQRHGTPTTRSARSSRSPRSVRSAGSARSLFHADAVQAAGFAAARRRRAAGRPAEPVGATSSTGRRASARCTCARAQCLLTQLSRRLAGAAAARRHRERGRHRRLGHGAGARAGRPRCPRGGKHAPGDGCATG